MFLTTPTNQSSSWINTSKSSNSTLRRAVISNRAFRCDRGSSAESNSSPQVPEFTATLLTLGKIEIRLKDDTYLQIRLQTMKGDSKRNTGYLLSYQDITKHKNRVDAARVNGIARRFDARYSTVAISSNSRRKRLTRPSKMHYPVSVIMFDLDDFKEVNDIYGHQAGDAILEDSWLWR
ncbi:MAG: diguanylate cyclase [Bacillus subtilis]|nr:diguanylate cyclase [Bacillus subtilis]